MSRRMNVARGSSLVLAALLLGGCSTAQKTMPHLGFSGFGFRAEMDREDFVVMRSVEGSSTTTSILGGIYQLIDGNKIKLFGIPFFKDKYTYFSAPLMVYGVVIPIQFVGPSDRAYYKALEKAPEADVVLRKSMDREDSGIPVLYRTSRVTFRGKALKIRADQ